MPKRGQTPKPLFEPCTGGGVNLMPPKWADFEEWVTLRRDNIDHLAPWEPSWNPAHLSRSAYRSRLAQFKKMIATDIGYPFHIFRADTGKLVGACNLTYVKRGSLQSASIGYWVGQEFSRQGFARAAVQAVLKFSFGELGLHRIEAGVRPENAASIKLLENAGFKSEGTARGLIKINGRWQDHNIFARLSSD